MQRAMEIIDRKSIERKQKEARVERARELRRQKKEEEQDMHYTKLKEGSGKSASNGGASPWWKVW